MHEWQKKISKWSLSTIHSSRTVDLAHNVFAGHSLGYWLLGIIIGFGCTLIGPFGTYFTMPFVTRLIYWEIIALVGMILWNLVEWILRRLLPNKHDLIYDLAIIAPFAALNSAFLVLLHNQISQIYGFHIPSNWLDFAFGHILLSTFVILPSILLAKRLIKEVGEKAGGEAINFLTQKLPLHLRGEIPFAMAADGHYVHVYTHSGDAMISLKFEDAMRAMAGINGLQTHRSWWVLSDSIVKISPAGSAYEATLKSGLKVPVSRRKKTEITDALKAITN